MYLLICDIDAGIMFNSSTMVVEKSDDRRVTLLRQGDVMPSKPVERKAQLHDFTGEPFRLETQNVSTVDGGVDGEEQTRPKTKSFTTTPLNPTMFRANT